MKIEKQFCCNGDDEGISGVEVDNSSTPAPDWSDWDSTPAQEQSDEPDKYY